MNTIPRKQLFKEALGKKNKHRGFSLIEMMVVITLSALLSSVGIHLLNYKIANHQMNHLAELFVQDAQFARQLSQEQSTNIWFEPLDPMNNWELGWQIRSASQILKIHGRPKHIQLAYPLLKNTQQFRDMSHPNKKKYLKFENGQIAVLHNRGFLANRIIWQDSRYPDLIRHIILGPGGRWRICDPTHDKHEC